jgi:hypothetical protein
LVSGSGFVAAWKIAPAIRGTGVSGIPARAILTGNGTMAVSGEERSGIKVSVCILLLGKVVSPANIVPTYRQRKDE